MVRRTCIGVVVDTQTKTLYLVMHHDDYRMSSSFFDPGTVVLYKNKKGKQYRVRVIEQIDSKSVSIQYRTKSHRKKSNWKKVSVDSLTPQAQKKEQTQTEESVLAMTSTLSKMNLGEQKQSDDPSPVVPLVFKARPDQTWRSADKRFLKRGDRFGVDIFNTKVLQVMVNFWTKNVPGDGWCLLHSANQLVETYGLEIHPYTKQDLRHIASEKQSDFVDDWTVDSKTGKTTKVDMVKELNDPLNLSEAWVSFLAKEMNCRFIIFTLQSRIDIGKGDNPNMDVWSFTASEVLPYKSLEYSRTCYLYNTGHYWPLLPKNNIDVDALIQAWGNGTFKHPTH